jgi:hypothetical protein
MMHDKVNVILPVVLCINMSNNLVQFQSYSFILISDDETLL